MYFSLINAYKETNEFVEGRWIQDHAGTIESAIKAAKETENANGNKIDVAVVKKINSSCPRYDYLSQIKRLDSKRIHLLY